VCETAGGAGPLPLGTMDTTEADGEEPLYCYCRSVSYGDMIACDSDDCPIEWFHYACVGIDPAHPPRGKWYCKECSAARRVKGK
jgi:inhibitor of growth protein 3